MGQKSAKRAEALRQLVDATKTLAAIGEHQPVEKSVDIAFDELTDVLRRCRHLESRGICTENSVVSFSLPNGINVSLMPKPFRADVESSVSLWSEYEQHKQRANDRQKQVDDPMRGTGRTTAGMLRAIAAALESPETWVTFKDHSGKCIDSQILKDLIASLYLVIDVVPTADGISLRSRVRNTRLWRDRAAARFKEEFGIDAPGELGMVVTEFGPAFIFMEEAPQLPPADEIVDYGSGELSLEPLCSSAATEAESPESSGSLSDATDKAP